MQLKIEKYQRQILIETVVVNNTREIARFQPENLAHANARLQMGAYSIDS